MIYAPQLWLPDRLRERREDERLLRRVGCGGLSRRWMPGYPCCCVSACECPTVDDEDCELEMTVPAVYEAYRAAWGAFWTDDVTTTRHDLIIYFEDAAGDATLIGVSAWMACAVVGRKAVWTITQEIAGPQSPGWFVHAGVECQPYRAVATIEVSDCGDSAYPPNPTTISGEDWEITWTAAHDDYPRPPDESLYPFDVTFSCDEPLP